MNREQARELLAEYALDVLSEQERAQVEAWLDDAELQAELRALTDAFADYAEALPAAAPSAEARARLMAAAAGPDRYSAVMNTVARVCDLTVDAVRAVLHFVDEDARWLPGPMPGILIQHFDHGPAAAGADTGFVRYPPNLAFPRHRHVGQETTIVLDGSFTDHDGRVYAAGDVLTYADATEHQFTVGPDGLTIVICFSGYAPLD